MVRLLRHLWRVNTIPSVILSKKRARALLGRSHWKSTTKTINKTMEALWVFNLYASWLWSLTFSAANVSYIRALQLLSGSAPSEETLNLLTISEGDSLGDAIAAHQMMSGERYSLLLYAVWSLMSSADKFAQTAKKQYPVASYFKSEDEWVWVLQ